MSKPKQPRKELTSLRLEPKTKYLAEIAARTQRRSLTNYIEWSIETSLKEVKIRDDINDVRTIDDLALQLWDTGEPERLIKLALIAPELLTYEEQLIFKVLSNPEYNFIEYHDFQMSDYNVIISDNNYQLELCNPFQVTGHTDLLFQHFKLEKVLDCWDSIKEVSSGIKEAEKQILDWAPN